MASATYLYAEVAHHLNRPPNTIPSRSTEQNTPGMDMERMEVASIPSWNTTAAIHQIFRHAGKRNRKTAKIHRILVTFCQCGEQTCQVLPFYDTRIRNSGRFQRKRNGEYIALRLNRSSSNTSLGIGGIREQEFPVLGIHHTVQLLRGISDRIQIRPQWPPY